MRTRLGVLILAIFLGLGAFAPAAAQAPDTGWRVTAFRSDITVLENGDVSFVEAIDADFGTSAKHGIFRDIITRQTCGDLAGTATPPAGDGPLTVCPDGSDRVYPITIEGVTDASGAQVPYGVSEDGAATRIKIGDPDRLVSGKQSYRVRYTLRGALNAFEGHDEFFWNATGNAWTVPLEGVVVTVTLPPRAAAFEACYQGYKSNAACKSASQGNTVTYAATRTLFPNEELTIVAGWQKGIVRVQPAITRDRVSIDDFFTFDVIEWTGLGIVGLVALLLLGRAWWANGRDRRYKTIYYLTNDPGEHTAPLFDRMQIVVEYLPPDGLRPAQMGVLVDERADTVDVTATIIDLAVRGYLKITELDKQGWLGKVDWQLDKTREAADELLPYERRLFNAIFKNRETVKVSALKAKFASQLGEVKDDLYKDALKRRWFSRNPETLRAMWLCVGIAAVVLGIVAAVLSGLIFSRALVPVPIALAGLVMIPFSRAMARRTATGGEALRRILGFKLYITTAETRRQEFNEQQNIFARYLPYAIVFDCVDKWADAFDGLDEQVNSSTSSWYSASHAFTAGAFAAGLGTFANSMSSTMTSTPGGSGGSGFSGGGSSGGGRGGGGGGSW